MATQGVDSAAFADQNTNPPYATLSDYCNHWFGSSWGSVVFWRRYFGPTDGSFSSMSNGSHLTDVPNELSAMRKYGIDYIPVLASPGGARIGSNNYTNGYNDAVACCNGIINVINYSQGHLQLPSNMYCRVYLDIEGVGNTNYASYWQGWYDGVFQYTVPGTSNVPFYPCAYVNPMSAANPCSVLSQNSSYIPYSIWTTEPDNACTAPAKTCQLYAYNWGAQENCPNIYTSIWQYAISDPYGCRQCYDSAFPQVDLDFSTPAENEPSFMLHNS